MVIGLLIGSTLKMFLIMSLFTVQHPWSFTGSRGSQPDGGRGSENCLAILNNFYNVS